LLQVQGLRKSFHLESRGSRILDRREAKKSLIALDGVSLELPAGHVLGLVGESGSGKSTLAKCIVGLLDPDRGQILYRGEDVRAARGARHVSPRRAVQLIYQNPHASLNPLMDIGAAIAEPAWVHGLIERRRGDAFAREMLELVGLSPQSATRRPAELSGGQRQRVAIARAMAVAPEMLIADEAISSLDVSAQAQILELLAGLREERGVGILLISHQLPVIAQIAETVAIMYLGRIVELGPVERVFSSPGHPYTRALLAAQPGTHRRGRRKVPALHGEIPSPLAIPSGCRFRSRCPRAEAICAAIDPPRVALGDGHGASCHFAG
jgi:oligopeptide/dipeptide ABC transporter ATP-binding protein